MAEPVLHMLCKLLPIDQFTRITTWTSPGSATGLTERIIATTKECLLHNPECGVIAFERLQDGGYEIRGFRKEESVQTKAR